MSDRYGDDRDIEYTPLDSSADEMLTAAFASYKSEATELFARPAPPTVFSDAKRHARRRVVTLGAAVAGSLSLLLGGVAVATTVAYQANQDNNGSGGVNADDGTGYDSALPGQGADPSQSADPGGEDPGTGDPDGLRNALLTLPAWPGDLASACPAGTFQFADGVVKPMDTGDTGASDGTGASGDPSTDPAPPPASPPAAWRILPGPASVVHADVDGVAGDEVLVPVGCGEETVHGLVAMHGDLSPIAFVYSGVDAYDVLAGVSVAAAATEDTAATIITVTVHTDGTETSRYYRWDGGGFEELSALPTEPTETPSTTPSETPSPTPPDGGGTPTDGGGKTDGGGDEQIEGGEAPA